MLKVIKDLQFVECVYCSNKNIKEIIVKIIH